MCIRDSADAAGGGDAADGGGGAADAGGGGEALRWRRGLLLIVDTRSVDRRAHTWAEQTYLRAWVESIEACGFVFLRHAYLPRSHALAFATRAMSPAEMDALPTGEEGAPAMHMRSEARAPACAAEEAQVEGDR